MSPSMSLSKSLTAAVEEKKNKVISQVVAGNTKDLQVSSSTSSLVYAPSTTSSPSAYAPICTKITLSKSAPTLVVSVLSGKGSQESPFALESPAKSNDDCPMVPLKPSEKKDFVSMDIEEPPRTQDISCNISDCTHGGVGKDNVELDDGDGGGEDDEVLHAACQSIFDKPKNPYHKRTSVGGVAMKGGSQTTLGINTFCGLVNTKNAVGAERFKDGVSIVFSHKKIPVHNVNTLTGQVVCKPAKDDTLQITAGGRSTSWVAAKSATVRLFNIFLNNEVHFEKMIKYTPNADFSLRAKSYEMIKSTHLYSPEIYELFSGYVCYHYPLHSGVAHLGVNTILKYTSAMINISKKRFEIEKKNLNHEDILAYEEFFLCLVPRSYSPSRTWWNGMNEQVLRNVFKKKH